MLEGYKFLLKKKNDKEKAQLNSQETRRGAESEYTEDSRRDISFF